MNQVTTEQTNIAMIIDDVIARGDLRGLTPQQRVVHYNNVCRSLGLNPLTQPFQYITLNGKLQLYARKDAADQLRKINGIKIAIIDRSILEGVYTVHVRATDKTGRTDEDFGAVSIIGLKGEAFANATMKAVTKGKRRVTLSISGLGFPDESEIDDQRAYTPTYPEATDIAEIEKPVEAEPTPPAVLEVPQDGDWRAWAQAFIAHVRAADTLDDVVAWGMLNKEALNRMQEVEPKMFRMLDNAFEQQRLYRGGEPAP